MLNREPEKTIRISGFDMWNAGPYPVCTVGRGEITVEVFTVTGEELESLDRLEGVPVLYQRITTLIPGIGEAFIYTQKTQRAQFPPVIGGDWCRYIRRIEHA